MTTHVGLTARALGADRVVFPDNASDAVETTRDITDRFGGPFAVETTSSPLGFLRDWDGEIVHLTMYGQPIQDTIDDIRGTHRNTGVLVVVGSDKVPFSVYEVATWNVAVTNQPHSEVAGLAVFLDHLFAGRELEREWIGAEKRVIPRERGKKVEDR